MAHSYKIAGEIKQLKLFFYYSISSKKHNGNEYIHDINKKFDLVHAG
jgi:hypothetical protein